MVRQKGPSLSPKHSLSHLCWARRCSGKSLSQEQLQVGKGIPEQDSIVSYRAELLEAKIQTLPAGKRSISAMGWFCLARISQPQERPDCLVSGFTDRWHVGKSRDTTSSAQRRPCLTGRRAHRLPPLGPGISWCLRGAQLQLPCLPPRGGEALLHSSSRLYQSFNR